VASRSRASSARLPPETTSFIGRQDELRALAEAAERSRLVTVWGPGGAGKTRLLLRFAHDWVATKKSAWFVDLTTAKDADDAAASIASALGVDGDGLVNALGARKDALILLDNFDQLVAHAGKIVEPLREANARFVVSSREPLGLRGEERLELAPLPEADAVALFIERARAVRPLSVRREDDPRIGRIVEKLDRLPLAIELLAARVEVLDPPELLTRLDRGIGVMRAAIAGSWDACSDYQKRVLAACSVFRGGFTVELAEAVCGDGAWDAVETLRRRSLLRASDSRGFARVDLYETVREFAAERLAENGDELEVRTAHARAAVSIAERFEAEGDEDSVLDQLGAERDNLLAAFEHSITRDPPLAARALLALHPLMLTRGAFVQHVRLIDRALAADASHEARLRVARGEVRRMRGEIDAAREDFDAALELARRDPSAVGLLVDVLRGLGTIDRMQGRFADARRRKEEALGHARASADRRREAMVLGEFGAVLQAEGKLGEARVVHARALVLHRELGSRRTEGVELSHLAVATHRLGLMEEARRFHEEALAIHLAVENRRYQGAERTHLGFVLHEQGDLDGARASYEEALRIVREVGDRGLEAVALTFLGKLEIDAGRLLEAGALLTEALERHRAQGSKRLVAITQAFQAHLAMSEDRLEEAHALYDAALSGGLSGEMALSATALACLGALERRLGRAGAEERFSAARAIQVENPLVARVIDVLAGAGAENPTSEERARSSDLRRTLAWVTRAGGDTPASPPLGIGPEAHWVLTPLGVTIDLSRRRALRLALLTLAEARRDSPGVGLTWEAMAAAGWPGERMRGETALKRVHTAIWTLRKLGLEGVVITRDDGYLLDPAVPIRFDVTRPKL
jgi:predicted ATPase